MAKDRAGGRIAIVTGASRGIGRAIAIECARHGMNVIIGYHTNSAGAAETCRLVDRAGGMAKAVALDLRHERQIKRLMRAAKLIFGEDADVLVNNAAIARSGRLNDVSEADWADVLAVDVRGVGLCIRHFASQRDGRRGDIVNIASTAGFAPLPRSPHYVAAKGGVIAMTRALALELAPTIRVNSIAPGFVTTTRRTSHHIRESRLSHVPLGRPVDPSEIARAALFLVTADVSVTGHTLVVDGGWSLNHGEVFPM